MRAFWEAWRTEIIRGATLFCVVLAVGLSIRYLVARTKERVVSHLPEAIREIKSELDAGAGDGPRATGGTWSYRARLAPKRRLWIRNAHGSITVEPGSGDSVRVTAVKTYGSSDTASVRLVAVPYASGIAVCALWPADAECGPSEGGFKVSRRHHNDVAVDFTVRLPRDVGLRADNFVGDIQVTGARGPLEIHTVSGDVDAATAKGPVTVESMNGNVHIRVESLGDTGGVSAKTINGSVTAELPARLDADVQANTVNGSIVTDYPLTVNGKFAGHDVAGTVGRGGRKVSLKTVNGSIKLKKAV